MKIIECEKYLSTDATVTLPLCNYYKRRSVKSGLQVIVAVSDYWLREFLWACNFFGRSIEYMPTYVYSSNEANTNTSRGNLIPDYL